MCPEILVTRVCQLTVLSWNVVLSTMSVGGFYDYIYGNAKCKTHVPLCLSKIDVTFKLLKSLLNL